MEVNKRNNDFGKLSEKIKYEKRVVFLPRINEFKNELENIKYVSYAKNPNYLYLSLSILDSDSKKIYMEQLIEKWGLEDKVVNTISEFNYNDDGDLIVKIPVKRLQRASSCAVLLFNKEEFLKEVNFKIYDWELPIVLNSNDCEMLSQYYDKIYKLCNNLIMNEFKFNSVCPLKNSKVAYSEHCKRCIKSLERLESNCKEEFDK